jgi:hypothetical protein
MIVGAGAAIVTIYGKKPELDSYLVGLAVAAAPAVSISNQSVNGHQRKRYPGGPSIAVTSHARRRVQERPKQDQTLPGSNAWIEKTTGTGASAVTTAEQFTFVGDFQDLKDYCKANAIGNWVLRSPNGAAYQITAP